MALRFVLDASVAVAWVAPDPGWERARRLRDALADGSAEFAAPDLYVAEVANVLWKKAALLGEMTSEQAVEALDLLLLALPELVPSELLSRQALHLASLHRWPVYDCLYAALAVRRGCPLVTGDARLAARLGPSLGVVIDVEEALRRLG